MADVEFLIKIGNQRADQKGYKEGMVVCWRWAGHKWSHLEKKHFAIVRIKNVTKAQAEEICSFDPSVVGTKDEVKFLTRRYLKMDELKKVLSQKDYDDVFDAEKETAIVESDSITLSSLSDTKDYYKAEAIEAWR